MKDITFKIPLKGKGVKSYKLSSIIDLEKEMWETDRGISIIALSGIKKIATKCGICMKTEPKMFLVDAQSQHWCGAFFGLVGEESKDKWIWADGEASKLNTGKVVWKGDKQVYEEFFSIDSKYRGAMATKRMWSRGILNFLEFENGKMVYSDIEASAFSKTKAKDSTPKKKAEPKDETKVEEEVNFDF